MFILPFQNQQLKSQHLNIISFNIPYPANYGGVIDVFYRIKALSERDVKIHLHCYKYGREESEELNALCEEVFYYERPLSILKQFTSTPFIVKTRDSKELLFNLLKNDYPILFEGLHACYWLGDERLSQRIKIVRSHNIEHDYYQGLSNGTKSLLKKIYFNLESKKLKKFETILKQANHILAISQADYTYMNSRYGKTKLMLPSHPSDEIQIKEGRGDYILYHADLSVHENIDAALFILSEIAPHVEFDFVIAGKNPSSRITEAGDHLNNVTVISNPSHNKMQELISNAHINLLPTFQATGFKLKLLNALFNGRFCVGTSALVAGTGLASACVVSDVPAEMVKNIEVVLEENFTQEHIIKRKELLDKYTNSSVVSVLTDLF